MADTCECGNEPSGLIKWRRVGWDGHVALMGEEKGCIGS